MLRPLQAEDAASYVAAFAADPDMARLVGFEEDPNEQQFAQRISDVQQWAHEGKAAELAVCAADEGSFAGSGNRLAFAAACAATALACVLSAWFARRRSAGSRARNSLRR